MTTRTTFTGHGGLTLTFLVAVFIHYPLLHDVSHFAFSHIADWVFAQGSEGKESFHNTLHEQFITKGEIAAILKKYSFSVGRIMNEKNFSLLEKDIPDLCADRVDYSLREFRSWFNPSVVEPCIAMPVNFNGEIVFADKKSALLFTSSFLELQNLHWGAYEAVARYNLFSKALEIALRKGVFKRLEFYNEERQVLKKLENSRIKEIEGILRELKSRRIKRRNEFRGDKVVKKFRYVDPKVITDGKLVRLSKLVPSLQKKFQRSRMINSKGFFV